MVLILLLLKSKVMYGLMLGSYKPETLKAFDCIWMGWRLLFNSASAKRLNLVTSEGILVKLFRFNMRVVSVLFEDGVIHFKKFPSATSPILQSRQFTVCLLSVYCLIQENYQALVFTMFFSFHPSQEWQNLPNIHFKTYKCYQHDLCLKIIIS